MRLTLEGDYAVRVVVDLATYPPGTRVRTADLTRSTDVPSAYLPKILRALARAGLVQTYPGQRGGVSLARDPATISLREMVEAVTGPIWLNRCLVRPGACPRDTFCPVHPVWDRIQRVLVRELESVTAGQLAEEAGARPCPGATLAAGPAGKEETER